MKLTQIPKMAIEALHPLGMKCSTDMEYARIATEVAREMAKLKIDDISSDGLKLLSLNITMYFEDIVADAGIWRGFTGLVKSEQGRELPFFDVDPENYYVDEPDLNAVKFLVWYTMLEVHHGRVGNPESPIVQELAEAAYGVLEKHFETVSVNEELKAYFTDAQFTSDFYQQRDMLKWLCFSCYLTYIPHLIDRLVSQAHDMVRNMPGDPNAIFYLVECLAPYTNKIGPLGLLPQAWAASILRANGKTKEAELMGGQRFLDFQGYKIVSAEPEKSITIENYDGEQLTVSADGMNYPHEECYSKKLIIGSFVQYNGVWYLNGDSRWGDDSKPFDDFSAEYAGREKLKEAYDKLKADTSIYYFADNKALEKFLLENIPFDDEVKKKFKLPESQNVALFISADHHDDFMILPDAALCLKDERNPYYNQKMALNQALNLALSLQEEVRDYVIAHNLLPDATINSSQGLKRGNEIVQQNFSFLVRAVASRL